MTDKERELAVYCLKTSSDYHSEVCEECINYPNCDHTIQDDVTETIIKVLEQEPCEDAVSRADTLQNFERYCEKNCQYSKKQKGVMCGACMMGDAIEIVESLPPVTPQQKTGHWFIDERPESDREIICSNCEQPIFKYHKMDFDYRPKYCPNCGARMVEPQERRIKDDT